MALRRLSFSKDEAKQVASQRLRIAFLAERISCRKVISSETSDLASSVGFLARCSYAACSFSSRLLLEVIDASTVFSRKKNFDRTLGLARDVSSGSQNLGGMEEGNSVSAIGMEQTSKQCRCQAFFDSQDQ